MPGMGDELPIAWMIHGLDAGNNLHQPRGVLVDMLDQRILGIAGPGNEYRAGICDRSNDGLKEIVIFRGVSAADGIRLVMDVASRMIGVQHQLFYVRRAEMEHAGFVVIDPNDRMKVAAGHGIQSFRTDGAGQAAEGRSLRCRGR